MSFSNESCSIYAPELRRNDYHPKVVAYYFKQWDRFEMPYHQHRHVEIMYVISGSCIVETQEDLFTLNKKDFILLDADVSHRLLVDEENPCRMFNLEFIFEPKKGPFLSFKDMVEANPSFLAFLELNKPYYTLSDPNEIYHTLKSLILELDESFGDEGWMTHLLLSELLLRISRMIMHKRGNEHHQTDQYVQKIIDYIRHHYDCDIQVKDIAASVNLHPGYLHRIFKHQMNCTIVEYLTSLRIEKAKMLLTHTDTPIVEISGYIGLNSSQYFSSIFKKHTGISPVEFRKSIHTSMGHRQ